MQVCKSTGHNKGCRKSRKLFSLMSNFVDEEVEVICLR